jgi:RNA polymerase sigma-70 factor (ECF subfamily)
MPGPLREVQEAVLSEEYRQIQRYLRRRVRLPSDADDLTQEVCARFLECRRRRQTIQSPSSYLMGIAHYVLSDFRRSTARRHRVMDVDSEGVGFLEAVAPFDSISQRMTDIDLSRLMAPLPRMHRAVVTECCLHGRSYAEAADLLGLSILTIEKYLTQARAQMRDSRHARELKSIE